MEQARINTRFEKGIKECYCQYSRIIVKFLSHYVGNDHIAEEIMQEVFLRLYERKINLDPESPTISNYLISMAKNLAVDILRKAHAEEKKYNEILIEEVNINENFYMNLEDSVVDGDIIATLYDTINSLPQKKREIIINKFFLMKKNVEIAKEMSISAFLINKITREVKEKIKRNLSNYFTNCPS